MANNRLYLRDTETGEEILLAKGYAGSHCWTLRDGTDPLAAWLEEHDFSAANGGYTRLVVYDENHPPAGTEIADRLRDKGGLCLEAASTIEHLLAINESLRREIRLQRKEIAGLRDERRMLLDADRPNLDADGGWLT
jgi:hypothetical protein